MHERPIPLRATLEGLPPEWPKTVGPAIAALLATHPHKLVVLDDDPTGTQTVHGVPVLTGWSAEALADELANDLPAMYVLTNSRALTPAAAEALAAEVGRNLGAAARKAGREVAVVSRSDSTLRGHFPGEVRALGEALGGGFDAWLLIPAFFAGGRYTIGDVHYVAEGDALVPAGQTPFARDQAFGYAASNLREWVMEKCGASAPAVAAVSIEDIRLGGPEAVAGRLNSLPGGAVCVVNAASQADLEVFTAGLLLSEAAGRRYLYRTAASFVPARAAIAARPLLSAAELDLPPGGGLVMVGSYVPKTTAQVRALLDGGAIGGVELAVGELLDERRRDEAVARAAARADELLAAGRDALVYTSRELVAGDDAAHGLAIGARVSRALCDTLRAITAAPRYLIAKGGITSSDLATEGLGVARAMVLGQLLPGVPVWRLGAESRRPGLAYVVFPGNVGGDGALAQAVALLAQP
jgi:uncharacterized protein YgbK (DUF1537 family)